MGGQGSKGCLQGVLQPNVEDNKVGEFPKVQESSAEISSAPKEDKVKLPSEPVMLKEEEAPTEASTEAEELTEAPQVVLPVRDFQDFSPSRKVEAPTRGPSDVNKLLDAEANKDQINGQQCQLLEALLTQSGVTDEAPTEASTETLEPVEAPIVEIPTSQVLETNQQEEPQAVLPVPEVPNFSPSREEQAATHGQSGVEKLLDAEADKEPADEISENPVEALKGQSPAEPPQVDGSPVKSAAAPISSECETPLEPPQLDGTPVESAAELVDLESETPIMKDKKRYAETPNCKENWDEEIFRNAEDEVIMLTSEDDAHRLVEESIDATNKKMAALGAMTFVLALKSDA